MSMRLFATHRVLWMPLDFSWQPPTASVTHCCEQLADALELNCDQHADPFDCPDTTLVYHEPFEEYGIPIRDGGQSYLLITHCPFCGTQLPESGRDDWFDTLERQGLEDRPFDALPEAFKTAAWRRDEPPKNS